MYHLPTFEEACHIVATNDAFKHTIQMVDGYKLHDFGYRLPGWQDFADPLKDGGSIQAYELRGLSFVESPDGTFQRYLMLNKFHCLNQTKGSMLADVQHKKIVHVSDKLDGSLIRFIRLPNGRMVAKSKGSFVGPHCEMALALLYANEDWVRFVDWCQDHNYAAIWEMTGPDNEVVLKYDASAIRLIQVRSEETGEYQNYWDWETDVGNEVGRYGVQTTGHFGSLELEFYIGEQKRQKGVEGWVVRFEDGQMIKVKTDWYEDMHRHFVEKQRGTRMYVEMTINETMDDALALMALDDPERAKMEAVMNAVSHYYNATVRDVLTVYRTFEGDPNDNAAKAPFVAAHKGSPNFPLYMFAINNPDDRTIENFVKTSILKSAKTDKDAEAFIRKLGEKLA